MTLRVTTIYVNRLLQTILDTGRKKGHRIAQIDVMIRNTPAQNSYEKAGFKVIDEKRNVDFWICLGEPSMRRMLMKL